MPDEGPPHGDTPSVTTVPVSIINPIEAANDHFMRLRDEGREAEATTAALHVAQLAEEHYGAGAIELSTPLINLAIMQTAIGDLAAAEKNYRSAIAIIERHQGRLSPRLVNPLSGLGHTYNRGGKYQQAIRAFNRALRLNHIALGFTNERQLGIHDGLTESYVGLKEYEDATFYQKQQLEIAQRRFGEKNPAVVPALYKLAQWYDRIGNLELAGITYRSADRILRDSGGPANPERAGALLGLAKLYEREGKPSTASSTLRKGIRLLNESPQPDRLRRASLRVALGDLYTRDGQPAEARTQYTAAWSDLSDSEIGRARRDDYFERPVRIAGAPIPLFAPKARGEPADMLADGTVTIRYSVDATGRARDVVVLESEPAGVMDESLLRIYRRSKFRPRLTDGKPAVTENVLATHRFLYDVKRDGGNEPKASSPEPRRGRLEYPRADDTG